MNSASSTGGSPLSDDGASGRRRAARPPDALSWPAGWPDAGSRSTGSGADRFPSGDPLGGGTAVDG